MTQPPLPTPPSLGGPPPVWPPPAPPPAPPVPQRTSSRGLVATAIALALLASVLAFYSLRLWQERRVARAELRTARMSMSALESKQDVTEQRVRASEEKLAGAQEQLQEAHTELEEAKANLEELTEQQADIDAEMREYREIAARFQALIDSGRLQVHLRRGRMVVDLPAQVLFPSGSAEISDEGAKALREVARILRRVKGKRFIVGGHTDNVKIQQKAQYSSNWALSAARAVAVTETLVRHGIRPRQLVAAGYGPHDPVASNRKESGRQQNRRIEIILEPRLRRIPERLEDKL